MRYYYNHLSRRLTRHVFQVVHVVRPDVLRAGQHVRFTQQPSEVIHVGVGDASVPAAVVAYVVHDFRAQGPPAADEGRDG